MCTVHLVPVGNLTCLISSSECINALNRADTSLVHDDCKGDVSWIGRAIEEEEEEVDPKEDEEEWLLMEDEVDTKETAFVLDAVVEW